MTESVVIALIGGACGWLVSMYLGKLCSRFLPRQPRRGIFTRSPNLRVHVPGRVGCGLVFGLAPVVQLARRQAAALRSRGPAHATRR